MYVCVCHAVTDRQIERAVQNGAHSLKAVSAELAVATCCGKCGTQAKQIIKSAVAEKRAEAIAKPLMATIFSSNNGTAAA